MGCRCGWTETELAKLAQVWVYASEDPVTEIGHMSGPFMSTMFERELSPKDAIKKKTRKSVLAKLDEITGDVQKIFEEDRRILVCKPTSVTKKYIFLNLYFHSTQ